MATPSTGDDQLRTLRELVRDAIEIARSAKAGTSDAAAGDALERARAGLAAVLGDLDAYTTGAS